MVLMPTLSLDNRSINYVDFPSEQRGQTLLLIHGAGGSHLLWQSLFDLPATRVVALDLPGHGQSDPPGRRTIEQYTAVIEAFVVGMGLSDVMLAGHSMGSAIALTAALRSVVEIKGLILFAASARMPVSEVVLRSSLTSLPDVGTFLADHGIIYAPDEQREFVRQQLLATGGMTTYGDFMACNRFDIRPHLTAINTPCLIIAGQSDQVIPLRFSESLAGALAKSRLSVLEGTGHYAMLERPEPIRKLVINYLRELQG